MKYYDVVIIGGGFFGCNIALQLKKYFPSILILEKEVDLLQRASYVNQARVHNGYHYPRSILTAFRSRINFPQFVNDYQECISSDFENYYAIGKKFSKVNANQFKIFCDRIGAKSIIAPQAIKNKFNSALIEEVFCVQEYLFDSIKIKNKLTNQLELAKIKIKFNSEVIKLEKTGDNLEEIKITFQEELTDKKNNPVNIISKYVFNCTYSSLNTILSYSDLLTIPLKHELTEMALVKVPDAMANWGLTVMCGPFFSLMPFPSKNLHTLSHVRYTPHFYWQDRESDRKIINQISLKNVPKSNYPYMIRDAQRYLSLLKDCIYIDSLWEIKTVLPQSEIDDSRPILFRKHEQLSNLICVLGGKIDNIYDLSKELQLLYS